MKSIIILSLGVLFFTACKKKDNKPTEYFSFDANGVHYEYPQIKKQDLFGGIQTLSAGPTSATVGYQIYAYSTKNPAARGAFTFAFASNALPDKDTFILGIDPCNIHIEAFRDQESYYEGWQEGQIVFTERSSDRLTGIFSFSVKKGNHSDTLTITNGKFSIIPAP